MTTTTLAAGVKARQGGVSDFPSSDGADAAPDKAKAHLPNCAPAPAAFHPLTPDQLARLSWHQRQRYERRKAAYLRTLEAERPPARETRNALADVITALADLIDPKPRPRRLTPTEREVMHRTIAAIDEALNEAWEQSHAHLRHGHILGAEHVALITARRMAGATWSAIAAELGSNRTTVKRAYDRAHSEQENAA